MTRSIFDPEGGQTERSGSRNLGPDAANISHVPPEVTDGEADATDGSDNAHLERLAKLAEDQRGEKHGNASDAIQ
jgi:hypothetical protein